MAKINAVIDRAPARKTMPNQTNVHGASVQSIVRRPMQYWYDPQRKAAWPFDGHYSGDDKLIKLTDTEEMMPIFDILPRLLLAGHKLREQDGEWHLFRADGEGLAAGRTFRGLCVNIVLAGF